MGLFYSANCSVYIGMHSNTLSSHYPPEIVESISNNIFEKEVAIKKSNLQVGINYSILYGLSGCNSSEYVCFEAPTAVLEDADTLTLSAKGSLL